MDNYIDKWTDRYIFANSDQRIVVKINHHWKLDQTLLSHQVTMATITMEPMLSCYCYHKVTMATVTMETNTI